MFKVRNLHFQIISIAIYVKISIAIPAIDNWNTDYYGNSQLQNVVLNYEDWHPIHNSISYHQNSPAEEFKHFTKYKCTPNTSSTRISSRNAFNFKVKDYKLSKPVKKYKAKKLRRQKNYKPGIITGSYFSRRQMTRDLSNNITTKEVEGEYNHNKGTMTEKVNEKGKTIIHNQNDTDMMETKDKDKEKDDDCDGFENFLDDLGVMNYASGFLWSYIGISSLFPSIWTQLYSYFSVYKIAVPSVLLLFFEQVPEPVQRLYDVLGIFDTLVNMGILLPIGDMLNYLGIALEIIGIIGLAVDTFAVYPELSEYYLQRFFGINVDELLEGYGCPRD